jgi:hypothetical protein
MVNINRRNCDGAVQFERPAKGNSRFILAEDGSAADISYHWNHKWVNACVRSNTLVPARLFKRTAELLVAYVQVKGHEPPKPQKAKRSSLLTSRESASQKQRAGTPEGHRLLVLHVTSDGSTLPKNSLSFPTLNQSRAFLAPGVRPEKKLLDRILIPSGVQHLEQGRAVNG